MRGNGDMITHAKITYSDFQMESFFERWKMFCHNVGQYPCSTYHDDKACCFVYVIEVEVVPPAWETKLCTTVKSLKNAPTKNEGVDHITKNEDKRTTTVEKLREAYENLQTARGQQPSSRPFVKSAFQQELRRRRWEAYREILRGQKKH